MTKQERAEMYRSYLSEEGYVPQIDKDGDVAFKFEGRSYIIFVDEKDDSFFRLVYPNFWSIENEMEREKAITAAVRASAETKVVKIFPVRDNTWAAVEMFCSPPDVFKSVFRRSLSALSAGVETFRKAMQ